VMLQRLHHNRLRDRPSDAEPVRHDGKNRLRTAFRWWIAPWPRARG
jgi:hypothetical protein